MKGFDWTIDWLLIPFVMLLGLFLLMLASMVVSVINCAQEGEKCVTDMRTPDRICVNGFVFLTAGAKGSRNYVLVQMVDDSGNGIRCEKEGVEK